MKFYSTNFSLEHKIKVQSAINRFAMSADGQHYALALVDGALMIRSRQLEEAEEEVDDEMKMMLEAFRPNMGFKATTKNYKYFFRG